MILHYFKTALRIIRKQKLYSVINILGLSISLAASFLILLYIIYEMSYDQHNENKDQTYRIVQKIEMGDFTMTRVASPYVMAPRIKSIFPEIEHYARVQNFHSVNDGLVIVKKDELFVEERFYLSDQSLFDILTIPIVKGEKTALLTDKQSLVLSESMAEKYFKDENPIGQFIKTKNKDYERIFRVTGVFKDFPSTSTFNADFIGNIEILKHLKNKGLSDLSSIETYILLKKDTNPKRIEEKIKSLIKEEVKLQIEIKYTLQNLNDVYFKSEHIGYGGPANSIMPKGNFSNIIVFSLIAFAILFIAAINFIIISTARGGLRSIEIGIRKTIGATRRNIIKQLLFESIIVSFLALPTAIVLAEIFLPIANQLFGKELSMNYTGNAKYIIGLLLITFLISLFSGSYISIYLSRFEPIKVLKSKIHSTFGNAWLRKTLISIQLIIFIGLIITTIIINKQIHFAQNKDLGFDRGNIIKIEMPSKYSNEKYKSFFNKVKNNPIIVSASTANAGIKTNLGSFNRIKKADDNLSEEYIINKLSIGNNYFKTFKMQIVQGRGFNEDDDKNVIVVNQTAVKNFGFKSPINKVLINSSGDRFRIIGVIKDFHIESMHSKIPAIIIEKTEDFEQVVLRLRENKIAESLAYLEKEFKKVFPNDDFNYEFFDSIFRNEYESENNFSYTIKTFTLLAIFIAAIGLFGLSTFLAKQRTKEIGIRKVFGAFNGQIIKIITKEFIYLVLIANVIAAPIAWYLSKQWLDNFEYQISIDIAPFILTAIVSVLLVGLVMGYNAYKAAIANPVESLRHE